jgi:hypothetical protein
MQRDCFAWLSYNLFPTVTKRRLQQMAILRFKNFMEEDRLPTADFYEEKAEILRRRAFEARDDSTKRQLTVLAQEFDLLAQYARRKGRASAD